MFYELAVHEGLCSVMRCTMCVVHKGVNVHAALRHAATAADEGGAVRARSAQRARRRCCAARCAAVCWHLSIAPRRTIPPRPPPHQVDWEKEAFAPVLPAGAAAAEEKKADEPTFDDEDAEEEPKEKEHTIKSQVRAVAGDVLRMCV